MATRLRILLTLVALLTALTGCAAAAPAAPAATERLAVVTSTNVWGAVVTAVGGDLVSVTSILDNPAADPHSFEAGPKVKLAMSKAALVVVNGGGYDDWATDTAASLDPSPILIDAVQVSGADDGALTNEHIFYSPPLVAVVAAAIAAALIELDPAHADTYRTQLAALTAELSALDGSIAEIAAAHPGLPVVGTEPVSGHLIELLGFVDVTPPGFSAAVEAETEVSVKDLDTTLELLRTGDAAALFVNEQAGGPIPDQLVAAAGQDGRPVIAVTETLPAGTTSYVTWIGDTLTRIAAALGSS